MKFDNIAPIQPADSIGQAAVKLAESFAWKNPGEAWQCGFGDGYFGYEGRVVNQFHSDYERGQISGMTECRNRAAIAQGAGPVAPNSDG